MIKYEDYIGDLGPGDKVELQNVPEWLNLPHLVLPEASE